VVEQGQFLTIDEEEIMHNAQSYANALYKRVGIEIKPEWPIR
jgi:hypothetical protein